MSGLRFSDNSYLIAILDRQGLMLGALVDLRKKNTEGFSPQGFRSKIKIGNPKIVLMSPTAFPQYTIRKEVIWQQYRLYLAIAEYQVLGGQRFLIPGPESGKMWLLKKVQYVQKKYHCQWTLLRGKQSKWIFHSFGDLLQPLEFVPASRERVVPTEWLVIVFPRQK